MAGNTTGQVFRLTTFGESHGSIIGGIIDGCPSGIRIDRQFISNEMQRRRAGQSSGSTSRIETDEVEIVSGLLDDITTGTPIGLLIKNTQQNSKDYEHLKDVYRPSHADYSYDKKYGVFDHKGGGRSSARETAVRVAAGAIAKLLLAHSGIKIDAYVFAVGNISMPETQYYERNSIDKSPVRCPEPDVSIQMQNYIEKLQADGDTCGGAIVCYLNNLPPGLGEPVFDKLQASLAAAMMSIPSAKAFEYGSGFESIHLKGSQNSDNFAIREEVVIPYRNSAGGILGGISTGQPIWFKVAFKAVSSLMKERESFNRKGEKVIIPAGGQHDVCVVPRAVAVVEAMAALVLADHLLRQRSARV
ncbi:MAG: chorismate synthase [Bacteroidales bacterium]|nr:chorismate synthase [Bacteroidales bacterium]